MNREEAKKVIDGYILKLWGESRDLGHLLEQHAAFEEGLLDQLGYGFVEPVPAEEVTEPAIEPEAPAEEPAPEPVKPAKKGK